jgi:hypothetical protein
MNRIGKLLDAERTSHVAAQKADRDSMSNGAVTTAPLAKIA